MKFGKYNFTNISISPEAEQYFKNIQPTKQNVLLAELVDGILRIEKDIKTVNKTNVTLLKQLYDSAKSIENQIYFISGRQQVMFVHKHIKNIESAAGIYCDCVNDKLFDLIQSHTDKNGGIVRKQIASKITYKAFKTAYPELIRKIDASGQEYFIDPYTQKHYRLEEDVVIENKDVDEVLASGGQIAKEKFESEALKSMVEGGFVPVVDVSGKIQKPLSKQVIITSSQAAIKVFSDNLKKQNWKGDYCVCILLRTNNSVIRLLYMPKNSPLADSKAQEVFYREYIASLARGMILISSSENGNYISGSDIKSISSSFESLSAKLLDVITYNPKNDRFVSYSDAGKMAKGGGVLLAPNGKPSNLTAEQYKLVRTPEFKAWFGDWENDVSNSSKVVDENGEPLVVYHRTFDDFEEFDNTKGTYKKGFVGGNLFYFSDDRYGYSNYGDKEMAVFINLRNPTYKVNVDGKYIKSSNDGAILKYDRFGEKEILVVATKPNQIKLADGSNTTFDGNNPDIRFESGGKIEEIEGTYSSLRNFIEFNPSYSKKIVELYGIKESEVEDSLDGGLGYDEEILIALAGNNYRVFYDEDSDEFEITKKKKKVEGSAAIVLANNKNKKEILRVINDEIYTEFEPRFAVLYKSKIVGGSTFFIQDEVYFFDLAISEKARGLGIAKELIDKIIEDAKKAGCKKLSAEVVNSKLLAYLRKIGFSIYKSQDQNYAEFDLSNNPDIRFENGGSINDNEKHKIEHLYKFLDDNGFPTISESAAEWDEKTFKINFKGIELEVSRSNNMDADFENFGDATYTYEVNTPKQRFFNYLKDVPDIIKYLSDSNSDIRYAKGGSTLLAPNGNSSNLTPEQWKLVRTPEFKAWFGDWENDPANSSKVVDCNGEPLVVFHGTNAEFWKFDKSKGKGNIKQKSINFSSNKEVAKNYGNRIITCFLNLKNPLIKNYNGENYHTITFDARFENRIKDIPDVIVNQTQSEKKYDGVIFFNIQDSKSAYDKFSVPIANNYYAFNNKQIKLADGSNTTFDGSNPDIRYENGGLIAPNGKKSNLTPEQYKLVRTKAFKDWFGDWENDPENASKVVDENGEPLVCYRGNLISQEQLGYEFNLCQNFLRKQNTNQFGFFFTSDINVAKKYMLVDHFDEIRGGSITSVFIKANKVLNLLDFGLKISQDNFINGLITKGVSFDNNYNYLERKIRDFDTDSYKLWGYNVFDYFDVFPELRNLFIENGFMCVLFYEMSRTHTKYKVYVSFESSQIKLADGTNITFDGSSPDIRFEQGGRIDELISKGVVELKIHKTTTAHAKEYGIESINPLYVQSIYVSEDSRLTGIGKRVLEYIDEYAIKNEHDVIFGHISAIAKFTKDNQETLLSDIEIIKNWLRSKEYQINSDNNDFYKIIRSNNSHVRLEEGGKVTPKGYKLLSDEIKPMILSDSNSVTSVKVDVVDFHPVSNNGTDITEKHIFTIIEFWNKNRISVVEECVCLFEDENRNPVALYRHSLGGISSAIIESILIAHVARLVNAKYCIIAHNHPSGNKNPSGADKTITYNLTKALSLVKCQLKDALIILPDNNFVSFYNEIPNNFMKKGGQINRQGDDNAEMALNQNLQIRHHTEELEKIIKSGKKIPAWIVSKMSRAADSISDATHYLDGTPLTYEKGGRLSDKDRLAELLNALDLDLDDDIKSVIIAEIEEINIRIKSQNPVDNFNAEDAEKAFRVLSDTAHYAGVYESTPDSVEIEWGKYGYSVSESYYESDLEMLYRAKNIFNSKHVGKMIASVHSGDKFITVRIISYNKLVNEVEEIQKAADNKEVIDYIKENYTTEAVSMYFEMLEAKNKKAKSKEEKMAKVSEQCGFEIPKVWFDSFEKAKKRSPLYSDYKLVISKSHKSSKKTDSAKELFAYAKSAEVLNEMKGNRTVTILLYYPTDYIEIQVDFEKRRITALYQTKELSPSEDITSEYLTLIKNIECAYNHILGEHIEKILDGKKYQVKNNKGQYYSVDISTGKPKWGGAAFGYTFSWIEANSVRDKLHESSNEIYEIVEYEGS